CRSLDYWSSGVDLGERAAFIARRGAMGARIPVIGRSARCNRSTLVLSISEEKNDCNSTRGSARSSSCVCKHYFAGCELRYKRLLSKHPFRPRIHISRTRLPHPPQPHERVPRRRGEPRILFLPVLCAHPSERCRPVPCKPLAHVDSIRTRYPQVLGSYFSYLLYSHIGPSRLQRHLSAWTAV